MWVVYCAQYKRKLHDQHIRNTYEYMVWWWKQAFPALRSSNNHFYSSLVALIARLLVVDNFVLISRCLIRNPEYYVYCMQEWCKRFALWFGTSQFRIEGPGPCLIINTVFPGMGIPMLKIRRSRDRLIFNMGIPILVRRHLYIETAPWTNKLHTATENYWYNHNKGNSSYL